MTPKEKAQELVVKYKGLKWTSGNYKRQLDKGVVSYGVAKSSQREMTIDAAKRCAIIGVDEIIATFEKLGQIPLIVLYWKSVKTEIEKL